MAHPLLPNSRSPPRRRKKSKKQSKKKRWRRSPSSSLSSSSSHSSSSEREEEDQKNKGLQIIWNKDQFKWGLLSELASYANTQFEKYILEKSLCDASVKKIDEVLKDLVVEKNKNNSLAIDEILGKIQKGALSVMIPLSKVRLKLEDAKMSNAPPLSLDEILSLVEQTICLLDQTSNSILYHRRYNILSSVCSPVHSKRMNEVEQARTTWNQLELSGTSWNHLEDAGTTWDYLEQGGITWNEMGSVTN